ncbi:MAG: hypothetical protein HPM95_11830 [Alphaproteobacteria bacterium]|nr:hypothetical protein [Alphaproteobacteria bacterium]
MMTVIAGAPTTGRSDETDLETIFVRLYTDFKGGDLNQTFERAGLAVGDTQSGLLEAALASASENSPCQRRFSAELRTSLPTNSSAFMNG